MADLFAPPSKEEILERKIRLVEALLNRFQEQLEYASTLVPARSPLDKAECIKKDFEDIIVRVEELKKCVTKNS